jgi:D-arabinose 1-dehydrogenase-like Zn-dependent alcohol dehydrogenase
VLPLVPGHEIVGRSDEIGRDVAGFNLGDRVGYDDPVAAAPLMCAGLIGWRSIVAAGDEAKAIGICGFGAAAHIIAEVCRWQRREVYAFTRPTVMQTSA